MSFTTIFPSPLSSLQRHYHNHFLLGKLKCCGCGEAGIGTKPTILSFGSSWSGVAIENTNHYYAFILQDNSVLPDNKRFVVKISWTNSPGQAALRLMNIAKEWNDLIRTKII